MMDFEFVVSTVLCFLVLVNAQTPVIQNGGVSVDLNEHEAADKRLHLLVVVPAPATCVQTAPIDNHFALQKRSGDPEFAVYFLAGQGALVPSSYTVNFDCDDGGGNTDSSFIIVNVIANAAPTFDDGLAVIVPVDASASPAGTDLYDVDASDTNSDTLTYSLDPLNADFEIVPGTGMLRSKVDLNTVTSGTYILNVRVFDGLLYSVNDLEMTVSLNNVNTPPHITNLPNPLTLPEDIASGSVVYTCTHNDTTIVGAMAISLAVDPIGEAGKFTVNGNCEVALAAGESMDFETTAAYTLTLTLFDGVYTEVFPFPVTIQDANDAPAFASPTYTMNILEGPLPNTPVAADQPVFVATDQDTTDTKTFSLGTGTYEPYFTIATTGELTNVNELDFDTGTTQVTISVVVTDSGGLTDTTTLTVNIDDYNDNDPVFAVTNTDVYISSITPVGKIGQVTATDVDGGMNSDLVYSEVSGGAGHFIVQNDGSLYLDTPVTEADRNTIWTVVMRAQDQGTPSRSKDTIYTIQFNPPPVLENPFATVTVSEDATGLTPIHQIVVTDNDTVSCISPSGATPTTPNPAFRVQQSPALDYWVYYTGEHQLSASTQSIFSIDVECSDTHLGKSVRGQLTIIVTTNQLPSLTCAPEQVSIDASATVKDDIVHVITATDTEPLTITLDITPSPGTFAINTAGEITAQKQMIREPYGQYTGIIRAADPYNTVSCSVTLTMTNTNEAPVFSETYSSANVYEDLAAGSAVATVTIVDDHECDPTTFTMSVDQEQHKFTATLVGKEITVYLAAAESLDKETVEQYNFLFTANDGCRVSFDHPLTVRVLDINEPPEFLGGLTYFANFDEINTPARDLGCFGIDYDVGDVVTLTLGGAQKDKFQISNPTQSQCILTQVQELDRDNGGGEFITLTMKIEDQAGLSADATITVQVAEINDNAPVCTSPSYTLGTFYNEEIGRNLGTVAATDDDLTTNGQISFSTSSTTPSDAGAYIEMTGTGLFKVKGDPSAIHSSGTIFHFTVEATDQGNPAKTGTCTVDVQFVMTTTPPPPTTQMQTTQAAVTTTVATNTQSDTQALLSNPVMIGVLAALGGLLLLLGAIGLVLCCRKFCCNSNSGQGNYGRANRSYDLRRDEMPSRGASRMSNGSPRSNQVASLNSRSPDITNVNEIQPKMHGGPTTVRHLF